MRQRRIVFLNGSFLPVEEARVSVEDPGFLLGDGVFETCGVWGGVPFLLEEHVERLRQGLLFTAIAEPQALPDLPGIVEEVVRRSGLQDDSARARITVTRGVGDTPTLLVSATAWSPPPGWEEGVRIDFARESIQASPWRQVKSTSRQGSVLEGRRRPAGIYDSLLWNTRGALTEGTYSNVFCVDSAGRLLTPRVDDGCLAGVTRAAVLQVAQKQGIATEERILRPADLATMQEIFLTSSMGGVVPVRSLQFPDPSPPEWSPLPTRTGLQEYASPGPVTRRIRSIYREWLQESTCRPT